MCTRVLTHCRHIWLCRVRVPRQSVCTVHSVIPVPLYQMSLLCGWFLCFHSDGMGLGPDRSWDPGSQIGSSLETAVSEWNGDGSHFLAGQGSGLYLEPPAPDCLSRNDSLSLVGPCQWPSATPPCRILNLKSALQLPGSWTWAWENECSGFGMRHSLWILERGNGIAHPPPGIPMALVHSQGPIPNGVCLDIQASS